MNCHASLAVAFRKEGNGDLTQTLFDLENPIQTTADRFLELGRSMQDTIDRIFEVQAEGIDLVVIAGDLHDRAVPAAEATAAGSIPVTVAPAVVATAIPEPAELSSQLQSLYGQLDAAHALLVNGRKAEIAGARTFVCERQAAEVAALLNVFLGEADV